METTMDDHHHHLMKTKSSTNTTETIIMAALSTLTPTQFSNLTQFLSSHLQLQNHHLHSLLSSPIRFSLTLQFLKSLTFHQKTLLISRYLLTTLKQLTHIWDITTQYSSHHTTTHAGDVRFRLKDADAVSLLFLLCEFHHHHHHHPQSICLKNSPMSNWRSILNDYYISTLTLTLTGIGVSTSSNMVLCSYIDTVTRCRKFLDETGYGNGGGNKEVGASVAAVVTLNRVEISDDHYGVDIKKDRVALLECVICKEIMSEGRDVCELPCKHLFHWMCVMRWLKKRNTCPCCRFQLPTDDLFGEIERLWGILVNKSCNIT